MLQNGPIYAKNGRKEEIGPKMNSEEKRQALIHQLSQESQPIGLQEILEKLGEGFAERTVRRWLSQMIQDGLVEVYGTKRATKYTLAKQAEGRTVISNSCFTSKSKKVIQSLQRPQVERDPVTYSDRWFESYKPNVTHYIPLNLRQKLYVAGKRFQQEEPAGTYANQIFNRLLIDLSYNSSRLEGNTYSLLDTERLLLEGTSAAGKLDEETTMILNHKEAIRHLVETAPKLEVSKEIICRLHHLLSDGLLEARYSGKVRDHAVRVTSSTYIPFEDPKQLQIRLQHIAEKAALIVDPYEQSLFLLIHISYLQAFSDVNKRTARLAANIPLIKNNLVPLSFNEIEKNDYISAVIAIYELQDVGPLLDLYLFSYMRTCAVYAITIKAMGFDEIRVRYRAERRAILRDIITFRLIGQEMREHVVRLSMKLVKEEDRKAFEEDVLEDLKEMDQSRIAGLGVSIDELNGWIHLRDEHKEP